MPQKPGLAPAEMWPGVTRCTVVLLALLTCCGTSRLTWAQDDAADTTAVGTGKVLEIQRKILDIIGMSTGIEGALADLGAKVTDKEIKIALSGDILFDFDKDTLRADAFPTLEKVAEVLAEYPGAPVLIEGHTDSKGKDKYNQNLSERRANSVKQWFVDNGSVEPGRIETKGWGEAKPAVPNEKPDGSDDPDGRQQNRRVEITIKTG